jgi:hypothetical protein
MTEPSSSYSAPAYLDESILLFKKRQGPQIYRRHLRDAADDLSQLILEDEHVETRIEESRAEGHSPADQIKRSPLRDKMKARPAVELLLHSLAHIASCPSISQPSGRVVKKRYVSIPLSAKDYSGSSGFPANRDAMSSVIKALCVLGGNDPWLEVMRGRYDKDTGVGTVTRVEPRRPLLDYLVRYRLVFPGHPKGLQAKGNKPASVLMLNTTAETATEGGQPDTAVPLHRSLTESESVLPALNEALARQRLSIVLPNYAAYEAHWDFKLSRTRIRERGSKTLYRMFKGEDGVGGRLYGHFVQQLPADIRPCLRINQQPVVEADYRSMQLALLYAEAGLPVPNGDPYEAEGLHREEGKVILTRSVGCATRDEATASLRHYLEQNNALKPGRAERIYDAFWNKHRAVWPHGPDQPPIWSRLQYADSEVALRVLRLLLDEGVAAIPVHDSFIVQAKHRDKLVAAMKQAWRERYPATEIGIAVREPN